MFGGLPQLTAITLPPPLYNHVTLPLRFFKHSIISFCAPFFPPDFPSASLPQSGRQRGSVLIWPGCMSGDNGPAANTHRPRSISPREPRRRFATVLLIGKGKQEADLKSCRAPPRLPSLSVFIIVLKFKRFGDVWSRKEIHGRGSVELNAA